LDTENAGVLWSILSIDREKFYFMEMNTRHPGRTSLSEEVYVVFDWKEQIVIDSGSHLRSNIATAQPSSHAIEGRINAAKIRRTISTKCRDDCLSY